MEKIKRGDIVARKSHNYDILFLVENIIKSSNGLKKALLKGLTIRIIADAYLDDLAILDNKEIDKNLRSLDIKIEDRINSFIKKNKEKVKNKERYFEDIKTGKILHLDGDKLYSEKSSRYYKKMGLNAIVRNVSEKKQPLVIKDYINKYKPDILVLTGHDRNDKVRYKIW